MCEQKVSGPHPVGQAPVSPTSSGQQALDAKKNTPEELQRLIDQAAGFNLLAFPDPKGPSAAISPQGEPGAVIGIRNNQALHAFDVALQLPSSESGVRAANSLGERAGALNFRWMVIPHRFMARPDREAPPTRLDPSQSQRFVMQEMTFCFGEGRDGFHGFGSGRTFPVMSGGRLKLVAAAVGNIVQGFGKFKGHEGNFTLCGNLAPHSGFLGHVVVRVVDPDGNLRTQNALSTLETVLNPDTGSTYLMWSAQKGKGLDQENRYSLAPDGQVRGMNIPVELKRLSLEFSTRGPEGFRARDLRIGEVIGRETGFGRGSIPDAPPTGTALSPYQFEGVARYTFHNAEGKTVGAITTNVLEGRRFDMKLAGAPEEPALRFGFFGPVISGSGCFLGAKGMFYGASCSVLRLPPGGHVITHIYIARLDDPEAKFRAITRGVGR